MDSQRTHHARKAAFPPPPSTLCTLLLAIAGAIMLLAIAYGPMRDAHLALKQMRAEIEPTSTSR